MQLKKALAALVCALLLAVSAQAAELAKPQGSVVVTVAGEIAKTNRPPYDATTDLFLKYHERSFAKAAEFDYAMLEALGLHEVEIAFEGWPMAVHLEGPRLKDLLAAVGAQGQTVTLVALDGYASEIPWSEVETLDWIVAIKRDGDYLGLGKRGPLWVVYTYPDGRKLTAEDELRWPWATFYIEIE